MRIGITGANGFVGRLLARIFEEHGHGVVSFVRPSRATSSVDDERPYEIDVGLQSAALEDLDVLVHVAFIRATRTTVDASERNIRGTLMLADAARKSGTTFVFLSSLSARSDAQSAYGRHKYALEEQLFERDVLIIRPGLVVGDGGLIRNLFAFLRRGVVPLVAGGNQRTQVVGTEDLAAAIEISLAAGLRGRITVCAEEPVTIAEMAKTMAARFRLKPYYLDIPWNLAFAVARVAERLGVTLPLTTENLLGIRSVTTEMPSPALAELGWRARTWHELLPSLSFGA